MLLIVHTIRQMLSSGMATNDTKSSSGIQRYMTPPEPKLLCMGYVDQSGRRLVSIAFEGREDTPDLRGRRCYTLNGTLSERDTEGGEYSFTLFIYVTTPIWDIHTMGQCYPL